MTAPIVVFISMVVRAFFYKEIFDKINTCENHYSVNVCQMMAVEMQNNTRSITGISEQSINDHI
jgi:hypothetical protein